MILPDQFRVRFDYFHSDGQGGVMADDASEALELVLLHDAGAFEDAAGLNREGTILFFLTESRAQEVCEELNDSTLA